MLDGIRPHGLGSLPVLSASGVKSLLIPRVFTDLGVAERGLDDVALEIVGNQQVRRTAQKRNLRTWAAI